MKVLSAHSKRTGWITAIICGRWVQAKVYDLPSTYGVNEGRVSKIVIGKTDVRIEGQHFFDQMDYNYDRGLDFDNLGDDQLLLDILEELENLPLFWEYDEEGNCLNG